MEKGFYLLAIVINFLSSLLFFWIQPLIAKLLLPHFGGVASVWTTSVLFFQVVLFIGYFYTLLLSRLFKPKSIIIFHLLVLVTGLFLLPVAPGIYQQLSTDGFNYFNILEFLIQNLFILCFILSVTSPYTQKVLYLFNTEKFHNPYKLYIASNIGSGIGLLGFIFIFEPLFNISLQFKYWNLIYYAYIFLLVLYLSIFLLINKSKSNLAIKKAKESDIATANNVDKSIVITKSDRFKWFLFSFIPVSILLCITEYISYEMAAIPLLWVVPLAIYLFSFQLAFSSFKLGTSQIFQVIFVLILTFSILTHKIRDINIILLQLINFSLICVWFNNQLYKLKPKAKYLTDFYCFIAFAGIVAGLLNTFIYPKLFPTLLEYPMLCLLALFIVITSLGKLNKKVTIAVFSLIIFVSSIDTILYRLNGEKIIFVARNFYGVNKVIKSEKLNANLLVNNGTIHGAESFSDKNKTTNTYYHHLDNLLNFISSSKPSLQVGIAGLGVGTLACYQRENDNYTFYEIDPNVVNVAMNKDYFSYLTRCYPKGGIVIGDARISIEKEKNNSFDLIIIDVYSSDSVPIHLLTYEAISMYKEKLKNDGLLILHLSNRYFNFLPVIFNLSNKLNMNLFVTNKKNDLKALNQDKILNFDATWAALSISSNSSNLLLKSNFEFYNKEKCYSKRCFWTDSYANILSAF